MTACIRAPAAVSKRSSRTAALLIAGMLLNVSALAQHAGHEQEAVTSPATAMDAPSDPGSAGAHDAHAMAAAMPPMARDPHAYAEGEAFTSSRPMLADMHRFGSLFVDNLEYQRVDSQSTAPFDLEAWYGGTYERAVIKAEGRFDGGTLTDSRTELHWSRAIAPYWDRQIGIRIDGGDGPTRKWLALGVEGLASGWWQIEAAIYAGESSRTAARIDVARDFLLSQRLVLQPRIEANAYGKADAARLIGSGLADVTAALRLRYEIRREVAPYIGVEWIRLFGETRALTRARGGDPTDALAVIGLRFWF